MGGCLLQKVQTNLRLVGWSEIVAHGDFFYVIVSNSNIEDYAITKKNPSDSSQLNAPTAIK